MWLVLLYIFFFFSNYLQQLIGGINYFDEALTIIAFFIIVNYNSSKSSPDRLARKALICIGIIFVIGSISTIVYHIQPEFAGVWRDALAVCKFPVCYYAYYLYSKKVKLTELQTNLVFLAKIGVTITFILGVLTFLYRIPNFYRGVRYGLPLFDMGFSHATFLVTAIFVLMATLISDGIRKNMIFIIMGAGGILFTLRSKPMLALVFLFLIYIARIWHLRKISKFKFLTFIVLLVVLTYYAAYSQITNYISYGEEAARGACYYYGADLANKYFPLGSGFCTFSSSLSGVYYSPLYVKYGLNVMEGLKPDDFSYAADTYWPNIFSQYGWIGFVVYLLMLYFITMSVHKRFKLLSDQWIAGMMLLAYCFAAAFAEAILTNDSSVIIAISLTIFIGKDYENNSNCKQFVSRRCSTGRRGFSK